MHGLALADGFAVRRRIAGTVVETPLVPSPHLSAPAGQHRRVGLRPTGWGETPSYGHPADPG